MSPEAQLQSDKLLRKSEAAEMLATSTRTIDRLASTGRLARVKIRGGARYRLSELQAIIKKGVA
jgi:excisionase family DNA binding protein